MQENPVNFNLSWNNHDNYWISVLLPEADSGHKLEKAFKNKYIASAYIAPNCFAILANRSWKESWDALKTVLAQHNFCNCRAAVTPSNHPPSIEEVLLGLESMDKIDIIADGLWLGDAILNSRVECHFQPIIDRTSEPFGYEAFARIRLESGELVSGARIIKTARELGIGHVLDKYLHILAIRTFAEARLPGNLFINFMAGFIQLPAKYLEGLSAAVQHYNLLAKRIVLDVSESENVTDLNQVSSIIDFCKSKGYAVALDDINSLSSLKEILGKLKPTPDFIKLDGKLTAQCAGGKMTHEISSLVETAHHKGSMIIAEGIEIEEVYKSLLNSGIDLFQGYYISQPMAVSEIKSLKKAV